MSNTYRPSAPARHTVVEEGTEFKGALTSSCPIDVRGKIEGDITTPSLTVSSTGAVHGRAKVGAVRSEGELSGEFDAESVELAGKVKDNTVIRARSLSVKLGSGEGKVLQVIFGECELSIGDEPTEMDAVEPAKAARASEEPAAAQGDAPAPEGVAAEAGDPGEAEAAEGEEDEEPAEGSDAVAAQGGKRRRKKQGKEQNGHSEDVAQAGWSQPPSQPPPAS